MYYDNNMQGQRPLLGYPGSNSFDNVFGGGTYQPPPPYGNRPSPFAGQVMKSGGAGMPSAMVGGFPQQFPQYGGRPGGDGRVPYVHPSQYQDPNAWYGPGSPWGLNPPQYRPNPPSRSIKIGGGGGIPNMFNNRNFFQQQKPNQGGLGPFDPRSLPVQPTVPGMPVPAPKRPILPAGQPIPGRKKPPKGTVPGYPNVPFDPPATM